MHSNMSRTGILYTAGSRADEKKMDASPFCQTIDMVALLILIQRHDARKLMIVCLYQ